MAAKGEKKPVLADRNIAPPQEVFWERYSPHRECLLSFVSSITLHGLVVGLLILIALTALWARNSEANLHRPPNMDVVQLEGGGDGGLEGGGSDPGPMKVNQGKTELVAANSQKKIETNPPEHKFVVPQAPELDFPAVVGFGEPTRDAEMMASLKAITQDVEKAMQIAPPMKKTGNGSTGKTGQGGLGGGGVGAGKGNKVGPGTGSGPGGRKPTRAQILANRWEFLIIEQVRDGKEHVDKLDAMGVILAIPDPGGGFRLITDLKRRPVDAPRDQLVRFKDAVKWYNVLPESIFSLAKELQIPVPRDSTGRPYVILLLPKDREEKMAAAEAEFARRNGRSLNTVRKTYFDFRLVNGEYRPVVLGQK